MNEPAAIPTPLARFSPEVQNAYRRYCATGDEQAVPIVVHAALLDFLPGDKQERRASPPDDSARLMEDLGYDSLAIAELVFFFEDVFKVTISTPEIRNVTTVADLRTFVAHKLAVSRRDS